MTATMTTTMTTSIPAWHRYATDAPLFLGPTGVGDPATRTAGQLAAFAQAIAAQLPARVPVVLACADRYAFAAALLAAWAKDCPVHLPPSVRPDAVVGLQREIGAGTILHDRAGAAGLDVRSLEPASTSTGAVVLPHPTSADATVVVYTSGSQGRPTPHPKTPAQLLGEAASNAQAFALAGATFVASVPCHHIYGLLFGLLTPLLAGGRIARGTPLFPAEVVRLIEGVGATAWIAVPPHLQAFVDTDAAALRGLRRVFSSGSPLPAAVAGALADAGIAITQVFGSTETGGIAFRDGRELTWRPLPGTTIATSPEGLLQVDSPWVVPAHQRAGSPVTTQDRVRLVDGGFVHEGRADSVVKVGGRRVDLGDIEARLAQIQGVRRARVIAEPGAGAHGIEILAVAEISDPTLTPAALRAELGRWLDPVALPRRIRTVDQLPVGPAGKTARAALLALFEADWTIAPRPLTAESWSYIPGARLGYFKGHFEEHPVLPAVVQLQRLALTLARQRWADLGPLTGLGRVKFRKLIGPGDEVIVALERPRTDLVKFVMTTAGDPVSSGNMTFAAAPPERVSP
jgi:acyl-CoA synthetase (AMP-forming)/AMP-acid ligase II